MLSDRISTLFKMLGCNNSDIAHVLDCSPSNISRIHSGSRNYSPKNSSIFRLVEGIYTYADNTNMLPPLCELCQVKGESREVLLPALIAWLFDTDEASMPKKTLPIVQKSERERFREQKYRSFGERLNDVMELLDMSNIRMARQINVDASHISRFRNGVRSPKSNSAISGLLAAALLKRAIDQDNLAELSKLTALPVELLNDDEERLPAFKTWLYDSGEADTSDIDRLLDCIDSFSNDSRGPLPEPSFVATEEILDSGKTEYWGVEGLREAVVRFLGNTVKCGGELWLYSDEEIGWMVGDKTFFTKWFVLMLSCVKRGVRVRIIHNLDRGTDEMISAIQSWMPLYMSGMIDAYVCRKGRDTRFTHTIFLRRDAECIYASHIKGTEPNGWYNYLVDEKKMKVVTGEYEALLSQSEPLVKIIVGNSDKLFGDKREGNLSSILFSLSLGTMPEKLITAMLKRNGFAGEEAGRITSFCRIQRQRFKETLENGNISEFSALPSDEDLFAGKARVNLSPLLCDTDIFYTPEEYACHIKAMYELLDANVSYRFYVLPELPFTGIQIIKSGDCVTVIRSKPPYAAFVFTEPMLLRTFDSYFEEFKKRYKCDRSEVRKLLRKYL